MSTGINSILLTGWMAFRATLTLTLFVCVGSCIKDPGTVQPAPTVTFNPTLPQGPLRILALGDSYTIGQGVGTDDRFPHQTVALLKQMGRNFAEPEYIAATGWTTANLLDAIARENKPKNYDVVTLLIGVNDQYQGREQAAYSTQFRQCLDQAIQHAGGRKERVFVMSIPDYSVTPFARSLDKERIAKEIDAFNSINRSISLATSVNYIEITVASRDAITDPTLVAADGLHPSAKEYRKWAEKLVARILTVLQ
ncbi:MAG TPA: SGNH/GDSL hydrolase family protein [Phnomibacter sp.]|nr:SGNH/GDSL hydrolase family protein [Phnomibacter sp.]